MIVVIPCFNEAERLELAQVHFLLESGLRILFVNDGSTDATAARLDQLRAEHPMKIDVLHLPKDSGKGEAVRQGLLQASQLGLTVVGYADADFATPATEVLRLAQTCRDTDVEVVLGSRVKLLGWDIERRLSRHFMGRVFATFASMILRLPVYDTQCGAKFFRVTPALRESLAAPFHSRWAFDVELIGRLLTSPQPALLASFVEIPLRRWGDIRGSKLTMPAMIKAVFDLWTIHLALSKRRRGLNRRPQ